MIESPGGRILEKLVLNPVFVLCPLGQKKNWKGQDEEKLKLEMPVRAEQIWPENIKKADADRFKG
jgi:hypothetical protein